MAVANPRQMFEALTSAVFVLIKARCRENDCREGEDTVRQTHTCTHTHAQKHTPQDTASSHEEVGEARTCRDSTKE